MVQNGFSSMPINSQALIGYFSIRQKALPEPKLITLLRYVMQ